MLTLPMVFIKMGKLIYAELASPPMWYEIGRIFDPVSNAMRDDSGATAIAVTITMILMGSFAGLTSLWYDRYRKDKNDI